VHKVKCADELATAIADAFLYDVKVAVEQGLEVREIELSVLENIDPTAPPLVSIPGEVVPQHEFYSYAAKYLDADGARLLIPAPLSEDQIKQAQQLAVQIFEVLNCEGMARVDLFLDKKTGEFVFNEVNTLPGFTQISMYPKLWEASGLPYRDLLTRLIELALARQQRKQGVKHEWALA
jgi:D-alanine-D-alanine ligase